MPESPRLPLLVGVVGHRDLVPAEIPAIREAIERLLRALKQAQPDVPVKLLSAQAEGADLLAADVAQRLGIPIVALLPFPEAQCRADLTSDAARAAFDRTMAGAEKLELAPRDEPGAGGRAVPGESRDRQFGRAGDLIAQHSSLLIAIWDGLDTKHRAGTARTVEERRSADELTLAPDNDLTYEIRCSRLQNAGAAGGVRVIGFVSRDAGTGGIERGIPPVLATLLERTAQFNRDARDYSSRIAGEGRDLLADGRATPTPALRHLGALFTSSDWLAVHFSRCFRRALAARFALWAAMAYLLLAFKHAPEGVRGLATIVGLLAVFGCGWLLAYWARRHGWDRRYLDYRALAEGLRVDFYWEMSGVRAQFDDAFAHEGFLQKQDAQIEWMRAAMRAVNLQCALFPRATVEGGIEYVLGDWIGSLEAGAGSGQRRYYRERIDALERRLSIAERISHAMLAGGLAIALTLAADVALRLFAGSDLLGTGARATLLMVLALLTAYSAIFEIYLAEKADRSLVRQYRHMDSLFTLASQLLQLSGNAAERLAILRALGHACLTEHAQWILAHREKRIDGLRW